MLIERDGVVICEEIVPAILIESYIKKVKRTPFF